MTPGNWYKVQFSGSPLTFLVLCVSEAGPKVRISCKAKGHKPAGEWYQRSDLTIIGDQHGKANHPAP